MSLTGFISYKRVGWTGQTPWNPTNLNIMDKGIKDNNDMIDNLRNEVSALNSNKVNTKYIIEDGYDLNNVLTSGFYRLEGTTHINAPTSIVSAFGQMIVCQGGSDTIVQIVFSYMYSNKFAIRVGQGIFRDDTEVIWRDWSYYTGSVS